MKQRSSSSSLFLRRGGFFAASFVLQVLLFHASWWTFTHALNIQHPKLFDNTVNTTSLRGAKTQKSLSNEIIIVLTDEFMDIPDVSDQIDALLLSTGGQKKFVYNTVMKGAAITNITESKMLELLDKDEVKYAVPNFVVSLETVQKNVTWGLDRIDQTNLPLNQEYDYTYTGRGVTVYVIDTGIRVNHTEFGGRATCEFTSIDYEDGCDDLDSHGTHVAGTVGGRTYGVAKSVKLVGVKVLDSGGYGSWDGVVAGIDYVAKEKMKNRAIPTVINMSLGGRKTIIVNEAVDAASRMGVVVVVAAGNDSTNACDNSPAGAKKAISVGATDIYDEIAYFSNYGPCVEIFAPGVDITSSYFECSGNAAPSCTASYSGTSMASPHVAGVAALYLQRNKTLTPERLWSMMRSDATVNAIDGLNGYTVNRLLNMKKL